MYRKTPAGVPDHNLVVKVGEIMMIIRNLTADYSQANGTRVQILKLMTNIILCRYISGPRVADEAVFPLARYTFKFGGEERKQQMGGVEITRIQFPLRPGLALTINKAQGYLFIMYHPPIL